MPSAVGPVLVTAQAAHALQADLAEAAGLGLNLALLNSCSGIDLARGFTAAGVGWVVCFREPVPTGAASQAFSTLLNALENGRALPDAVLEAGHQLERTGPAAGGAGWRAVLRAAGGEVTRAARCRARRDRA